MRKPGIAAKDAAALRSALAEMDEGPAPGETERALRALAPQINAAACRLADRRAERRFVRLQALALAGCSGVFLALLWLACQYKAVFLASPARWGTALGIGIMALLAVVCLPVFIKGKEISNETKSW